MRTKKEKIFNIIEFNNIYKDESRFKKKILKIFKNMEIKSTEPGVALEDTKCVTMDKISFAKKHIQQEFTRRGFIGDWLKEYEKRQDCKKYWGLAFCMDKTWKLEQEEKKKDFLQHLDSMLSSMYLTIAVEIISLRKEIESVEFGWCFQTQLDTDGVNEIWLMNFFRMKNT